MRFESSRGIQHSSIKSLIYSRYRFDGDLLFSSVPSRGSRGRGSYQFPNAALAGSRDSTSRISALFKRTLAITHSAVAGTDFTGQPPCPSKAECRVCGWRVSGNRIGARTCTEIMLRRTVRPRPSPHTAGSAALQAFANKYMTTLWSVPHFHQTQHAPGPRQPLRPVGRSAPDVRCASTVG